VIRPLADPQLDLADVQGNILKGYNFPFVAYVWVRVDDPQAGRALLGRLLSRVTTGEPWNGGKPRSTLNVGITFAGLQALDVPSRQLDAFSPEFREGMAARAAVIGDRGEDDPSHWDAGLGTGAAHVLVTINAVAAEPLEEALAALRRELEGESLSILDEARGTALSGNREHFGFSDGFAQPAIEGDGNVAMPGQGTPEPHGRWSELALGEFLMGYEDEDGEVVPGPAGPLGSNATYMVYRKLHQDVAAFRRALRERAAGFPGGEERLAAKIVGRWRDGTPVELSPDAPDPGLRPEQLNAFRYGDDADGRRCPLGAHIRRVNPRDALGWHGKRTRRHRMIRRGMPYGPPLPEGTTEDDGRDRGLFFLSFCGSLRRQFEIVQAAWAADGNLFGLGDDRDWMLLSDDRPTAKMTIQGDPPHFVAGQPRFVTVRGGEYLFVPSIAGLRSLSV
jgi:Dyp-type peroxidase family